MFIVVDGGPGGVYNEFLKPRLIEIKNHFHPAEPLPISMVMVSHMDDDHVNGVLDLTGDLVDCRQVGDPLGFNVSNFWFNTFDDIIGNLEIPVISGMPASASAADLDVLVPQLANLDRHISAVISSTGQGRKLNKDVAFIGSNINNPFHATQAGGSRPVRLEPAANTVDWQGLSLKVIHPSLQRLNEMQKKWDKDLKRAKRDGDDSIIFASIASKDTSPFNLASIVCLIEFHGKKILITGDARDDDILEGMKQKGLLKNGDTFHVDVLKIPHHGSDRNMSTEFFRRVTADHYIISGDGSHHNPDKATLTMLSEGTHGRDNFTVHFTNRTGKHGLEAKLDQFLAEKEISGRTYRTNFLQQAANSIKIDLLNQINY